MVVSGHTPLPPPEGDSGDETPDDVLIAKEFDSRRNIVLIKMHCIQTRLEEGKMEESSFLLVSSSNLPSLPGLCRSCWFGSSHLTS